MKVEWYKYDCPQEQREERAELVKSAAPTLAILKKIIQGRIDDKNLRRRSQKLYESPNWSLMQADLLGAERELQEILDLLTIEAQDG